ncbi:MAG: hypothetical protein H7Y89_08970 [Steroidobacteraceae bacterium]|nr:hypothetical protein [Steroidobacteraceae bacterium]
MNDWFEAISATCALHPAVLGDQRATTAAGIDGRICLQEPRLPSRRSPEKTPDARLYAMPEGFPIVNKR